MTKGKRQLRAEAVERLRMINAATGMRHIDVIEALVPDAPRVSQDIHAALVDLLADDEPSESNLAYHFATDEDFRVSVCEQAFARLSDSPEHPWEVAPWLEAGHADGEACAESYTYADAEARNPRSCEAVSGVYVTSEGAEVTLADCGHCADMSRKCGGCVRDGGEMSEVASEVRERSLKSESASESDAREELEADELEHLSRRGPIRPWTVLEWLDRQAAITESECLIHSKQGADALYVIENAELQDKLDELTAERDYWRGECDDMYQVAVDPLAEPLGYPNEGARPSTMVMAVTQGRDQRIADLEAERDERARAADAAGRRVKELENELANMTCARDHWRRVAGKHAKEMQTLRRALKLEQERTVNELPEGVVWPHFEDGACVGFGDVFVGCDGEPHELACVKFLDDGYLMMEAKWDSSDGFNGYTSLGCGFWSYGETFERPPVLASDGQPIEIGQVLYGESDGKKWTVTGISHGKKYPVLAECRDAFPIEVEERALRPEWLTHEQPWELEKALERFWHATDGIVFPSDKDGKLGKEISMFAAEIREKLAKEGA